MKKQVWIILALLLCIASAALAAGNGSSSHMAWEMDEKGTLTLSGEGTMDAVFTGDSDIRAVVIGQGITDVSDKAFMNCANLSSVTLPESVTKIGAHAFRGCGSLTAVTLPKNLAVLGERAFASTGLKEVTVPDHLATAGAYAFGTLDKVWAGIGTDGAKALGKAGIRFRVPGGNCQLQYRYEGNELKGLDLCAADSTVKSIIIPEGVTKIAKDAFSGWNGTITFLEIAPAIDAQAFSGAALIAVYPHEKAGWASAVKGTYGAKWIAWQADNAEPAKDQAPKSPTEETAQTRTDNEGGHNYDGFHADTVDSYIVPGEGGAFTRVEHTGDSVIIEQYSAETKLEWKKTLKTELPLWGGFYAGKDYYFFLYGQENDAQDDSREVVRVVRYSKNWNRMDSAGAFGQNTALPFLAGTADMEESGDYLYIHTTRQMYAGTDGQRSQANLILKLYIPAMSFSADAGDQKDYISHSFGQTIYVDEGNLIVVDHGDTAPRAITIGRAKNDPDGPGTEPMERVTLLKIGGENGQTYTGATVGGSQASDTKYIVTGKSIDQANFNTSTRDNIYVVTASKSDFSDASVSFRWQTNHREGSTVVLANPYLIRISGTRLLLMWTERLDYNDINVLLHYVFLDENGLAASQVYTNPGRLSDVEPAVNGNTVTWYVTTGDDVIFYTLDLANPQVISTVSNLVWLGRAGWTQDAAGHWLYGTSEGYALTGLQSIDGTLYLFDGQGIMATGWVQAGEAWYCAASSGALYCKGWEKLNNRWYYFRSNGVMATGWLTDGKLTYYLAEDGVMATGWVRAGGNWYCMDDSGAMQTAQWIKSGGKWYYLRADGAAATGWLQEGGAWYYLDGDGAMQTGWIQDGGSTYYLNSKGVMQTGWLKTGGKWYYLEKSGAMKTGWLLDGGKWYFLDKKTGVMATGWVRDDGDWYYLNAKGAMQTGWIKDGRSWYYLKGSGAMQTGWLETRKGKKTVWYWFDDQGAMATGWKEIDGAWEKFGDDGAWQYTWDGK